MTCASVLYLNPGSDYRSTSVVRDATGAAVNLTGYTAEVLDGTGDLVSGVAFTITNAALGETTLAITWGAWLLTLPRAIGSARLRLSIAGAQTASIPFDVQTPLAPETLVIPRAGDVTWNFIWPDDSNGVDMTGQTVEAFNVSTTLAGRVSITVVNAATREVQATVEGSPSLPIGDAGTFSFRRSTGGVDRRTLIPIRAVVK